MLLMLVGLLLGAVVGFFTCVLTTMAQRTEIREACEACHARHMQVKYGLPLPDRFQRT